MADDLSIRVALPGIWDMYLAGADIGGPPGSRPCCRTDLVSVRDELPLPALRSADMKFIMTDGKFRVGSIAGLTASMWAFAALSQIVVTFGNPEPELALLVMLLILPIPYCIWGPKRQLALAASGLVVSTAGGVVYFCAGRLVPEAVAAFIWGSVALYHAGDLDPTSS